MGRGSSSFQAAGALSFGPMGTQAKTDQFGRQRGSSSPLKRKKKGNEWVTFFKIEDIKT